MFIRGSDFEVFAIHSTFFKSLWKIFNFHNSLVYHRWTKNCWLVFFLMKQKIGFCSKFLPSRHSRNILYSIFKSSKCLVGTFFYICSLTDNGLVELMKKKLIGVVDSWFHRLPVSTMSIRSSGHQIVERGGTIFHYLNNQRWFRLPWNFSTYFFFAFIRFCCISHDYRYGKI